MTSPKNGRSTPLEVEALEKRDVPAFSWSFSRGVLAINVSGTVGVSTNWANDRVFVGDGARNDNTGLHPQQVTRIVVAGSGGHDYIDLTLVNASRGFSRNLRAEIDAKGGNDVVYGSGFNDLIRGGAGNDTLGGSDGNDAIYGDAGDDLMGGGFGNDSLWGGAGRDYFAGDAGDDWAMDFVKKDDDKRDIEHVVNG